MDTKWRSYEEVATYLLNQMAKEFGLKRVERKQKVQGARSGTTWTIDAKGVRDNGDGFVIVECRRYTTSKQNQERLGSFAYRIHDAGAAGGIIVSPLGIQKGAAKIAAAENIVSVQLDANCTPTQFTMQFLNRIFVGLKLAVSSAVSFSAEILRKCVVCGKEFEVRETEGLCPMCRDSRSCT